MAEIPWFAWIAIVAIIIWGITMVVGTVTGRDLPGSANSDEFDKLKKRVKELEKQAGRDPEGGAGASAPAEIPEELENRLQRLESRADKRDARAQEHDAWERRARDLGLDDDPPSGSGATSQ